MSMIYIFVCMSGIAKTNKKGFSGQFVECYTRQRRHTWEPVKLFCRVLWLWTRQRCIRHSAKRLPKGPTVVPFAESPSIRHLAKKPALPSAYRSSRQMDSQKEPTGAFFAECQGSRRSTKEASLPSVW
jgi:hypothetical protein